VAFNDGEAAIEQVLVSTDMGGTWRSVPFKNPSSPYGWYRWSAGFELPSGKHQVWAKAVDALKRGQPLDGTIDWNPQGYAWSGVEKIEVTVA
jgi:hypothetical protein